MDGVVTPSRRINDSFALVSTGAPGVDVLHENRKLGKTDSSGHLLVPDLIPYQANRVSIDVENLPVDTRLESTKAVVVPQSRSGVVANFQLERYVAATVILKTPDGQFLPPGAGVLHAESGKRGGGLRRHDLRRGPAGAESPDGAGQGRVLPRAIRIWRRARPAIAHAGPVRLPAFGGAQAMRRAILLVAIVFAWAWAGAAQANRTAICRAVRPPLTSAPSIPCFRGYAQQRGLIKVNCLFLFLGTRVCISLGTGNTSPSIAARAMGNGSYRMNYNLYTDPGYSSVWGAATTSPPTSQVLTDVIDASLSVPIYAKLPGGQTSVSTVGNADTQYQEIYSGASVHVEVQTALFFLIRSIVRCPLRPGS